MYEQFANNYSWNLAVVMALGAGGEMSEIADACRPLANLASGSSKAAQTEAWFQNWSVLGQRLERMAEASAGRGWMITAGKLNFRAANYYLFAERMMHWGDPRKVSTYRKALGIFETACKQSGHRTERVEVLSDAGQPLAAYLRLPEGKGPFPTVIFFNGFDSIKEMHYLMYANDAVERGLAILFIDQEGTGEAMRFHDIKKRFDSEHSAAPFIDYLETRADIDAERIGTVGISNGGYDAPRAASFEERLKCAACIGAFYNADDFMGRFDGGDFGKVVVGVSDLDEHMMKVFGVDDVTGAYRKFAERDLGAALPHLKVPLLVVHGENDRQAPLWHSDRTIAEAVNSPRADYKIFTLSEGSAEHCGLDITSLTSQYIFDWVAEVLGGEVAHKTPLSEEEAMVALV